MSYQVYWTCVARQDLSDIVDYIAQDSVDNALRILQKLEKKADDLDVFPQRGRIVPELLETGISQYREIISSPWRIIYRLGANKVYVMGVFDSRRDLEGILLNRLIR